VEIGGTVIEVKKDLRPGRAREDAARQLHDYVERRQRVSGRRYVGVITDGAEWRCYHLMLGALVEVADITIGQGSADPDRLVLWLEGVLATARDIEPTPTEIATRLGAGSSAHKLDRASIAGLYAAHRHLPTVATKRRLWARLLTTALGTHFDDDDELFVEHTLLVCTAEIIAHAVLGIDPTVVAARSLLSGARFEEAGIAGVVEEDFFNWLVEVPEGEAFVKALAYRISRFDWTAVEHDVLKVLYESVIGADTRKKLGEYYTPDWLAEKVVEATVDRPSEQRVLDPSCGSGTFLFHAVRRYLAAAAPGTPTGVLVDGVTDHVFGMDLHPVAVTLARVTYLLAIGRERLTSPDRGVIRIPVFLGDSLQWRQKNPSLFTASSFIVEADDKRELDIAKFEFPTSVLDDIRAFDDLLSEFAERARAQKPGATSAVMPKSVLKRIPLGPGSESMLNATFQTMCRLHREGRDHIWSYYIRNLARPEWLARPINNADVLVGNPPWLAYRYMPSALVKGDPDMQADFKSMSEERGLWQGDTVATHQDLAGLFVARSIELYLRRGGRFGFVMQSAVLDRQQYRGFRTGSYLRAGAEVRVAFKPAWDLRKLRPHFFPITACVVFGNRCDATDPTVALPKSGEVWAGKLPRRDAMWIEVAKRITRSASARTVDGTSRSPYHARFSQGASLVPRMLVMVERREAGPLGHPAGSVPVRSLRSNNEKKPWKGLPALEGNVENEFIYRVHLGETVLPHRILTPLEAVIPRESRALIDVASGRLDAYRGLARWFGDAEDTWEANRSSERLKLIEQFDFRKKLLNQFPIQPERVVYSKSGMHLSAARLTDHRAIVDHVLYWGTAASAAEAHYLCAILNAPVTTQRVRPLMSFGKDERHIDKYVWQLPIPLYDARIEVHARLAALGAEAEKFAALVPIDETKHFAASRRMIRDALAASATGQEIEALVSELLGALPMQPSPPAQPA